MLLPSLPIPPSRPSKSDSYPDATPLDLTGILELRVNSPSVSLYPEAQPTISNDILAATAMTPGANSPSTPSICLLRAPLGDFVRYSRREASKWLIDLPHDICDPADQRGSLVVAAVAPVATTDPLTASVYRYNLPVGITVGLSKISRRNRGRKHHGKSREGTRWKVLGECGNMSTSEQSHLPQAHGGSCWANYLPHYHISPPTPKSFNLCFLETLDAWFDEYDMGLRFVSPVRNYSLIS